MIDRLVLYMRIDFYTGNKVQNMFICTPHGGAFLTLSHDDSVIIFEL